MRLVHSEIEIEGENDKLQLGGGVHMAMPQHSPEEHSDWRLELGSKPGGRRTEGNKSYFVCFMMPKRWKPWNLGG